MNMIKEVERKHKKIDELNKKCIREGKDPIKY